jgi:hypothetical protein
MNQLRPWDVLQQVAKAVPEECRGNIVIIGSLAAAYAYSGNNDRMVVRTKDIDCLLNPFQVAIEKGEAIARKLRDAGWQPRQMGKFQKPGTPETPNDELPAIRLYPPGIDPNGENAWFIELLTVPASSKDQGKQWTRIVIDEGHFGLPSYRYLSVTAYIPEEIDQLGIYCARPEMMALANLLEHPEIKPDRMSALFAGLEIKRSNKDLGRVLAIGYLAQEKGVGDFRPWGFGWQLALKSCFPEEWKNLAKNAGTGLMKLLDSDEDFTEAYHTCTNGLLSSFEVTKHDLKEVSDRLLGEAVETLKELVEK